MDTPKDKQDHQLRLVTLGTFLPALGLNIAAGAVTCRPLPALGMIPMGLSAGLGLLVLYRGKRPDGPHADLLVGLLLLTFLVISWVSLATESYMDKNEGMLCAYATMPLIVNFLIHITLTLLSGPQSCPNCAHTLPSILPTWQRRVALPANDPHATHAAYDSQAEQGRVPTGKEIRQSLMRGFDEDARESSEFQTSGFNTPRQSAETLRSSVRSSGEGLARPSGEGRESLV